MLSVELSLLHDAKQAKQNYVKFPPLDFPWRWMLRYPTRIQDSGNI